MDSAAALTCRMSDQAAVIRQFQVRGVEGARPARVSAAGGGSGKQDAAGEFHIPSADLRHSY